MLSRILLPSALEANSSQILVRRPRRKHSINRSKQNIKNRHTKKNDCLLLIFQLYKLQEKVVRVGALPHVQSLYKERRCQDELLPIAAYWKILGKTKQESEESIGRNST